MRGRYWSIRHVRCCNRPAGERGVELRNNNEEMINVHAVSVDTVPENVDVISFGYMHPGAIKWFEDNGYEISEDVYPPDYPY